MRPFEEILAIDSAAAFDCAALELFRFQAERCGVYREYLAEIGVDPAAVRRVDEIPMLPIEFFKWRDVYCGDTEPQIVFTSSNTGQSVASHHMMASTALYEAAFTAAFERFYGNPARWSLYGLLPNYLQREGSSLVYMVDRLIGRCGSGGFYLDDYERLLADMAADPKPKILLGVSYALWDLAERYAPKLRDTIVMETGGMKGRREELPKEEFHRILCEAFGVDRVHSEYGMAELTSQAYSDGGGRFRTPGWMRVAVRDVNDPFCRLLPDQRGGVDIIDLANRFSCAFILRRSPRLDRNETLGREIYDAFTAEVVADVYLLAHATSPFIRPATIAAALHKVTDEGYDSAFSAERMQTFAWYRGEPLNYALDAIPRTQEIEPVFVETSAFFIFRREIWCDLHQRIGRHPYVAVVDRIEGIDIDYPEDFALAEVIAKLPNR